MAEKHHPDRNPALRALAGPLLLLVICVGFFWKLVLTDQYTWLEGPDTAYQILPWYQFQAGEWHAGRMPMWDPYHWGGQSLIGQAQPGAAYPLNWLLFWLPLKNGWLRQSFLHWYYVLIHFQAALFCYWLCRDLGRSFGASLLAGLIFGLGGYVGTTDWPQMLNGAVWAPLVLLFFLRAMRGDRPVANSALSGACLGAAFLSGHHQIPVFTTLVIGGIWLFHMFRDRRLIRLATVFALFMVLVSALQTLPAYEYGKEALRWVGAKDPVRWNQPVPYNVHQQYSFYPMSLLGIVVPGIHRHANPFVGVVAVTMALMALLTAWRDSIVRLFAAIAAAGLILALGQNSVFHGLLYALVPMVEKARNPSMAIFIFHFGLSCLIAYGFDSCSLALQRRLSALLGALGGGLMGLMLVLSVVKAGFDERIGITALACFVLAGLLRGWPHAAGLIALALLELGNVTGYALPHRDEVNSLLKKRREHADIAEFLRSRPEPVRVDVDDREIPYNFGDWWGVDQFGGYLASMTVNIARAQGSAKAKLMLGTNYYIGKEPNLPGQQQVFESKSGLKVFRNPSAFPRVWVVHRAERIERDEAAPGAMERPGFDPAKTVLLAGTAQELETCEGMETVRLVERSSDRVVIEADLRCRGMIVLGETYFPGWKTTVDGRPAPLYEAYTFLRGVVAEAGGHRIEMQYRPWTVYWGGALTALGVLGAVALRRWGK